MASASNVTASIMYHYVLGLLKHLSCSDEHCCWEQGLLGKVQMCGIAFMDCVRRFVSTFVASSHRREAIETAPGQADLSRKTCCVGLNASSPVCNHISYCNK